MSEGTDSTDYGKSRLNLFLWRTWKDANPSEWVRWPSYAIVLSLSCGLAWQRYGLSYEGIATALYILVFGSIAIVDLRSRQIPNLLSFPGVIVSLVLGTFWPGIGFTWAVTGAAVGFGILSIIWIAPGRTIGAGDVKLGAGIGAMTGFPLIIFGLVVAISIAGTAAILLLLTRTLSRDDNIPFGPFLAFGGLVSLRWGSLMIDWFAAHIG